MGRKNREERGYSPHKHDIQPVGHIRRQVPHVLPVLRRQEHRLDARPQRPDQLLLDAPDGRDPSAE